MAGNPYNEEVPNTIGEGNIGSVKNISDALKKVNSNINDDYDLVGNETENNASYSNGFKVANTNLPVKTGFWTKVRNALFYEVKIELTPYQQKIEDEINDFLHQEITWKSLKEAALSEVPITFRGKRIF